MGNEREILEPYLLSYSDLITLSSPSCIIINHPSEIKRLESVTKSIMESLGPTGPGLLAITGLPNASNLRNTLLPLAPNLSLLSFHSRQRILQDHGLGSDVPLKNLDRCVSSFAMQLKYGNDQHTGNLGCGSANSPRKHDPVEANCFTGHNNCLIDNHFKDLRGSFRELGFCMIDLGLRLARICDRAIGGGELEQSLLESGTAKGRLIHYHSFLDTRIIKESGRRKRSQKGQSNSHIESLHCWGKNSVNMDGKAQKNGDDGGSSEKTSDLWQQWHYDYGTFTVLTSPMFFKRECCLINGEDSYAKLCGSECPSPNGHTYLQIFHPNKNKICIIKAPSESFILQVGESADILSRRKLHSTLHSVSRPTELENISRETFVVFLHPAWDKVFDTSDYPMEPLTNNDQCGENEESSQHDEQAFKKVAQEIHKIIPPLSSRLKNGMTFSEFSRETTRQYYGGRGLQSNR